jgi:DNA excision repair protein ERCC-5
MILLALLTGSDYTDGIPDVGPVTAMEILAEFPGTGVEPLKEFKKWWNEQQGSGKLPVGNKNREKLRRLHVPNSFPSPKVSDAYLFPSVDNSTEAFSWAVPNFVEIRDFAQEKFGWTRQKVDELIKPVIKRFDERVTQAKIDRFFLSDRSSLPSKGHLQNSKRVQSAVEKVLGRKSLESDDIGGKKVTKKTSPGKKKATPSPAAKPLLSRLEAEEARKMDAKAKAAEMLKMKGPTRQRKKKATRGPKRLVMAKHNLSESDSSDG